MFENPVEGHGPPAPAADAHVYGSIFETCRIHPSQCRPQMLFYVKSN